MADFVFFGHGGRGAGTETGTYVVPPNCTIHFFEADGQLLNMQGATVLLDWLLRDHPYTAHVLANEVVQSFGEYQTIPDYTMTGDAAAATACSVPATGVYIVGRPKTDGPVITLASHVKRKLSSLVGSKSAAVGTNIFWMCCRATGVDTNTTKVKSTASTVATNVGPKIKARDQSAGDVGLKPSEVVARGRSWR